MLGLLEDDVGMLVGSVRRESICFQASGMLCGD